MTYTGLIVLIIAIIAIHKIQSECNSEDSNSNICTDVCNTWSMNGTCAGDVMPLFD